MKMRDFKVAERTIECECGCAKLVVDLFDWRDHQDEVSVNFCSNYLGSKRNKLRALWNCLRGKETYYAEVLMDRANALEYFKSVVAMLEENQI